MQTELEKNRLLVAEKIARMNAAGCEKPYNMVPTLDIRCFVPCKVGHCVCNPDLNIHGNHYTIVDKVGTIKFNEWYIPMKEVLGVK